MIIRDLIFKEIKHGPRNILKLYSKIKTIEGDSFDLKYTEKLTHILHLKHDLLNYRKRRVGILNDIKNYR